MAGAARARGDRAPAFGFEVEESDLSGNTFVANDIARFDSDTADVFLDSSSHDTVFVGRSGTVIDLGARNDVTGFKKVAPPKNIGSQIADAVGRRNAARGPQSD